MGQKLRHCGALQYRPGAHAHPNERSKVHVCGGSTSTSQIQISWSSGNSRVRQGGFTRFRKTISRSGNSWRRPLPFHDVRINKGFRAREQIAFNWHERGMRQSYCTVARCSIGQVLMSIRTKQRSARLGGSTSKRQIQIPWSSEKVTCPPSGAYTIQKDEFKKLKGSDV